MTIIIFNLIIKMPKVKNIVRNSLKCLRVYVLIDREYFIIHNWVETFYQHADSLEEKLGFQWFAWTFEKCSNCVSKLFETVEGVNIINTINLNTAADYYAINYSNMSISVHCFSKNVTFLLLR